MANQSEGQETNALHGFIMPDGEAIALEEVGRMCTWLGRTCDDPKKLLKMIDSVAMECLSRGLHAAACDYLAWQLYLLEDAEGKACCLLRMGAVMEQAGDFEKALHHYTGAFDFPPGNNHIWYFLNNNRGYCLNMLGRHREAEGFCRAAIGIGPKRHNAWKNLGVSLQGQGRIDEAALSYCEAAERAPRDPRAFRLLEDLLMDHPEILEGDPVVSDRYRKCSDLIRALDGVPPFRIPQVGRMRGEA